MSKKKPWDHKWKILDSIGGGGQGSTYRVESVTNGQIGCLKTLSNNKSLERRGRFHRECSALQTLDHPQIPKYIDSNSDKFETDERLYVVTDYISGKTLTKTDSIEHQDAIHLIIDLLNIIEYVHNTEIVHRDIKPDNIIIEDSSSKVFLVDFGLSYQENDSGLTTASDQQMGNRFLHLPELQHQSGDKRNPISDLSQIVGILFYLLIKKYPVLLNDERGLMPHQRESHRDILKTTLPSSLFQSMCPVFDRGFTPALSNRWQSASELRQRLENIISPPRASLSETINDFSSRLVQSSVFVERDFFSSFTGDFARMVRDVFNNTFAEFTGEPYTYGTNQDPKMELLTFTRNQYITVRNFSQIRVLMAVSCVMSGNELLIRTQVDNGNIEDIGRVLASKPVDWSDIKISLRLNIFGVLEKVVNPLITGL